MSLVQICLAKRQGIGLLLSPCCQIPLCEVEMMASLSSSTRYKSEDGCLQPAASTVMPLPCNLLLGVLERAHVMAWVRTDALPSQRHLLEQATPRQMAAQASQNPAHPSTCALLPPGPKIIQKSAIYLCYISTQIWDPLSQSLNFS
jgi:hypothetical protein